MIIIVPAALAVFTLPLKSSIVCTNIDLQHNKSANGNLYVHDDLIMMIQTSISTFVVSKANFVPEITLLDL